MLVTALHSRRIIAAAALAVAGLVGWLSSRRIRLVAIEVAGHSMSPALQPGDFLVVRAGWVPRGARAAGSIIYARGHDGRPLLKRIVAVPGESVRAGAVVQINGRTLVEPYAHGPAPAVSFRGVQRLGPDAYFVLGDRRDASTDSRDFGPLPAAQIEGVAWLRYWPVRRAGWLRSPRRHFLD